MLKRWSQTDYPPQLTPPPHAHSDSKRDSARIQRLPTPRSPMGKPPPLQRRSDPPNPRNRGSRSLPRTSPGTIASISSTSASSHVDKNRYSIPTHRCLNGEAIHPASLSAPRAPTRDVDQRRSQPPFDPPGGVPFRPLSFRKRTFLDGHLLSALGRRQRFDPDAHPRLVRQAIRPIAAGHRPPRIVLPAHFPPRSAAQLAARRRKFFSPPPLANPIQKARRIEDRDKFQDLSLKFTILNTPAGLIDRPPPKRPPTRRHRQRSLSRRHRPGLRHASPPTVHRRRELAIGSIVDLRPSADQPLNNVFDLLLGFTSICCKTANSITGPTDRIRRQTNPPTKTLRPPPGQLSSHGLRPGRRQIFLNPRNSSNSIASASPSPAPIPTSISTAAGPPNTPATPSSTTSASPPPAHDTHSFRHHHPRPELSLAITYRSAILSDEVALQAAEMFIERLKMICDC